MAIAKETLDAVSFLLLHPDTYVKRMWWRGGGIASQGEKPMEEGRRGRREGEGRRGEGRKREERRGEARRGEERRGGERTEEERGGERRGGEEGRGSDRSPGDLWEVNPARGGGEQADGIGDGVTRLRRPLHQRCQLNDPVVTCGSQLGWMVGVDPHHLHPSLRQGPRLVQHDGADAMELLERGAALDEDTKTGADTRADLSRARGERAEGEERRGKGREEGEREEREEGERSRSSVR
eukprot:766920-Hanusia_phi.AAC.2